MPKKTCWSSEAQPEAALTPPSVAVLTLYMQACGVFPLCGNGPEYFEITISGFIERKDIHRNISTAGQHTAGLISHLFRSTMAMEITLEFF